MSQIALGIQKCQKIDCRFYFNQFRQKLMKICKKVHLLTVFAQVRVKFSEGVSIFFHSIVL